MSRIRIKLMYKIHGIDTANGMCRSAGNDTFYETYDEALERARSYVDKGGWYNRTQCSMVIYKAHVLVRASHPPVEILQIQRNGEAVPLMRR